MTTATRISQQRRQKARKESEIILTAMLVSRQSEIVFVLFHIKNVQKKIAVSLSTIKGGNDIRGRKWEKKMPASQQTIQQHVRTAHLPRCLIDTNTNHERILSIAIEVRQEEEEEVEDGTTRTHVHKQEHVLANPAHDATHHTCAPIPHAHAGRSHTHTQHTWCNVCFVEQRWYTSFSSHCSEQ